MSEELIIKHCSPTLAGLKTGNMFMYSFTSRQELNYYLRLWNRVLVKKGLRVIPLRIKENRALIYLYRPGQLSLDWQNKTANYLLSQRGYSCEIPERCITHLIKRIGQSEDFPHEIGLFLGYPPEDVYGFIENRAEGYKCVGCWKVYGDAVAAQKLFAKYKKCTEAYTLQLAKGRPIEKLVLKK